MRASFGISVVLFVIVAWSIGINLVEHALGLPEYTDLPFSLALGIFAGSRLALWLDDA